MKSTYAPAKQLQAPTNAPPPQQQEKRSPQKGGPLEFWYRFTSPPEPKISASFEEKELFRRGRTGSQISIMVIALLCISYPAAFAGSNSLLVAIITIDLLIVPVALVLNRMKMVNIAGIIVVLCTSASPVVNIVTTPDGINASTLPIFGLLVFPLMCAVSFLPPWWVFIVAAINCLFALYALSLVPASGELAEVLRVAFPGLVTPIILSQIIVALATFLAAFNARQAILRADRAEEIAQLEAAQRTRQEEQLVTSRQTEEGIQKIIATMNSVVSNNDFSVKVPLGQENILWRVGMSINNLLSRLQGLKQSQEEVKRTRAIATEIARHIKNGQPIPLSEWTGTAFDPVIMEHNNRLRNRKE